MLITLRGQKVKNVQTKRTLLGLVDLLKITIFQLNFVGTSFCILCCKKKLQNLRLTKENPCGIYMHKI